LRRTRNLPDFHLQMFSKTFEPENRLVARGLETEWEKRLRDLAAAEVESNGEHDNSRAC